MTVQDWVVVVDFVDIAEEESHQGAALPEAETHPHKGYQAAGLLEVDPREVGLQEEAYKIQEEVVMDMSSLQVEEGHRDTTQPEDHLQKQFQYIINSILYVKYIKSE